MSASDLTRARSVLALLGVLVAFGASCGPLGSGAFFEEVGVAAGIGWSGRARDSDRSLMDRMDAGVCILDLDGVAPRDIFFASRADGSSALFQGVGVDPLSFRDVTASFGLAGVGDAIGCLAFDAEGDGDDDLLLTGVGYLALYLREGTSFVSRPDLLGVTVPPGHALVSSAAGDLDADGDLDLVVAGFVNTLNPSLTLCDPLPCELLVAGYPGVPSYLLENQDGRFVDRTGLAPDLRLEEPTLVVAIADLDGDGTQDIFVGNDVGANYRDRFLQRVGATFVDRAMSYGLATNGMGHGVDSMGIAMGDVDGDGVLDVTQTSFQDLPSPIWICGTDGFCPDVGLSRGTGVTGSNVRWSNALLDVDLDGDLDLFETRGHVFRDTDVTLEGVSFLHEDGQLLLLNGRSGFVNAASGALSRPAAGRGLGVADLDDDGRLDLVVGTTFGRPRVYLNTSMGGHFLRVVLVGDGANTRGIGARVEVRATDTIDGPVLTRVVRAGEGYASTFDPRVHFGLADPGPVDVTVHWAAPPGAMSTMMGVAVDAEIVVRQTTPMP